MLYTTKRLFVPLLLTLLLPVLAGCKLIGDDVTSASDARYAFALRSCAPTDGPALEIILATDQMSCTQAEQLGYEASQDRSLTRLYLYGISTPKAAHTHTLGTDVDAEPQYSQGGWGEHCPAGKPCATVQQGTVIFLTNAKDDLMIEVTLHLEDGTHITNRLPLVSCERNIFCG